MNKIYNQSGIEIIACGNEGSPIRCKEQFNITFPKLFDLVRTTWYQGSIYRHTDPKELFYIMEEDNIDKSVQSDLSRAVYFYFTEWQKENCQDCADFV